MASSEKLKEIAQEAIDFLDDLNRQYPNLASGDSKEAVEKWRRHTFPDGTTDAKDSARNRGVELNPDSAESQNSASDELIKEAACDLLKEHDLEDVLDILASEHNVVMDAHQLVGLVGQKAYVETLQREARVFKSNSITYDQAASLWNSLNRPALGDEKWTGRAVSMISDNTGIS